MDPRRSDTELDELLGRGSIGAGRRDAILETVLARVKVEKTAKRRRWVRAGIGATAVAIAASLLVVPQIFKADSPGFRAKGAPGLAQAGISVECLGGELARCPVSSLLVISASGLRGYISAWAEPTHGGERIWYFAAEASSPFVDATAASSAVATRAVRIGKEHKPGAYVVELRVTETPMSRAALMQGRLGQVLAASRVPLIVTKP